MPAPLPNSSPSQTPFAVDREKFFENYKERSQRDQDKAIAALPSMQEAISNLTVGKSSLERGFTASAKAMIRLAIERLQLAEKSLE